MDRAGERLKRVRERLRLTYRDVVEASHKIAARRGSDDFAIALSRLADIENQGTVPTIYRIYTLCAIYRLDINEVLAWYGVPTETIPEEAVQVELKQTHMVYLSEWDSANAIQKADHEIDPDQTTFLSHLLGRWGKLPLSFLNGLELRRHRYGFIGMQDWSMYPILPPGSLVVIDDGRRKIATGGWTNEFDRPIYFFEHRQGYLCGWCSLAEDRLMVQPHPSSQLPVMAFDWPGGIDLIGQVIGAAMPLETKKRRHVRSGPVPATSPDL
jgi:transcriptional regulator with XRE-family HTH domain